MLRRWRIGASYPVGFRAALLMAWLLTTGTSRASTSVTLTEENAAANPWSFPILQAVTIPTLSEWGMLVMALLIAALAFVHLRRHPGLVGAGLMALVLSWTGILMADTVGLASHVPSTSINGTTMRFPLNPTVGQTSVRVVARLEEVGGSSVTGMTLHYQKLGSGSWSTAPGSPWGAPVCVNCWAADLPLAGYVEHDQLRYYVSAETAGGPAYLFDGHDALCGGATCGTHSMCFDDTCLCNNGWTGASCDSCAAGYYGPTCASCPDCGTHGDCNDTLAGNGACTCDTGWTGASCDGCANGYAGPACCPAFFLSDGQCVAECSSGFHLSTQECVDACPSGFFLSSGECVTTCPFEAAPEAGPCEALITGGFFLSTGACVDACDYLTLPTGECADQCNEPQLICNSVCVDECPAGYVPTIGRFCVDEDDVDPIDPIIPPNQ